MKLRNLARLSLGCTLGFGALCTICSSSPLRTSSLQDGVLYVDWVGINYTYSGSLIVVILSLFTFVLSLIAYRHKEIGKKLMVWSIILLGVAVLVLVGSRSIALSSSCMQDAYCTVPLPLINK